LRFPSGYIGDPPGSITFGDVVLIYEPTEQQMADMVTPAGGTIGTLSVGTLIIGAP
jgi:hypothetical protein